MAGGAAGAPTPSTGTTGLTQQYNSGSNWDNPVRGNAWQNPTTGSPYMGVGSQSPTGAMTYQPPTSYSQMPTPYGDLNNPANAAGRRQQAIDQSTQAATQAAMNQQLPNSTGMGGYGYGRGYNPQGGFGYNPYGGGIAGLYGAMGMGGQGSDMRDFGPRGFNPYTTDIKPPPGSVAPAVQVPPTAQGGRTEADWTKYAANKSFANQAGYDAAKKAWMAGGSQPSQQQFMNNILSGQTATSMPGPGNLNPQAAQTMQQGDTFQPTNQGWGGSFGQRMGAMNNMLGGGAPTSFGPSYGK